MKRFLFGILFVSLLGGLAACTTDTTSSDQPVVMTTLFPHYDIARALAGDFVNVELALPLGTDAHTFDPTPAQMGRMLQSDLFIYTGDRMELWVQRALNQAQPNLRVLDVSRHVRLLYGDDDLNLDYGIDTFEVFHTQASHTVLAYVHGDHWHGSLRLGLEETAQLSATIVSEDGLARDVTTDSHNLVIDVLDPQQTIIEVTSLGDSVEIKGLETGSTYVTLSWQHQGVIRYTTPPFFIEVDGTFFFNPPINTNESADHSNYDPHYWTDPLNVILMVEAIRDELILLLPEREAALRFRANEYITAMEAVHQAFLDLRENIEIATLLYGGHNAMFYFNVRYQMQYLNAYAGFSSDAEPVPQAITQMIQTMRDNGIEHLFTEKMLAQNVARTIQQETGATILYLFDMENVSPEDDVSGITLLDMFEHNLAQLKIGLRYHD